jgi:hypothetical protein
VADDPESEEAEDVSELDLMKRDKEETLIYWKKRLKMSRTLNERKAYDIQIIPDTLEWFLWMIDGHES